MSERFKKIEEFPKKWISIVHCSTHLEYSRVNNTSCNYKPTFLIDEDEEWGGCRNSLTVNPSSRYPDEDKLIKPYRLYQNKDSLLFQLYEDGHWFWMIDPYIHVGCDSCDGETSSSFTLYEAIDLHDMIFNCFTESMRILSRY